MSLYHTFTEPSNPPVATTLSYLGCAHATYHMGPGCALNAVSVSGTPFLSVEIERNPLLSHEAIEVP